MDKIIGIKYKFNPRSYERNDPPCRKATKKYFYDIGMRDKKIPIILLDNPDKYGPDLMLEDGSEYFEVYHCRTWKNINTTWPYRVYNLPQKKGNDAKRHKCNQVGIDLNYTMIALVSWQDTRAWVMNNEAVEIPNKRILNGEYMYEIPGKYVESYPLKVEIKFDLDNFVQY